MKILYLIFALAAVLLFTIAYSFNHLIRLRNKVDNAWKQIDVQLDKRYRLVPLLANMVEGYAKHEHNALLESVRTLEQTKTQGSKNSRLAAEDALSSKIAEVLAVAENLPELKAEEEFEKLRKELVSIEASVAGSRKYLNGAVMYYENARQQYPYRIVARVLSGLFPKKEYFAMEKSAEEGSS